MRQLSTISHDGPQQQQQPPQLGKCSFDRNDESYDTNDLEKINCKYEGINDILKSSYGHNTASSHDDSSVNSCKYSYESVRDEKNNHTKSINEKIQDKKVDLISRNDKDNSNMVLNSTSIQTNPSSFTSSTTSASNKNNEDFLGVKI